MSATPSDKLEVRASVLRQILEAVVERSEERPKEGELRVISGAELMARPLLPRWRSRMDAAAVDGPMESLYASIREEGWRAFAEGGLAAMLALADRACGDNDYLSSILDHRWDGIGTAKKGVWCA